MIRNGRRMDVLGLSPSGPEKLIEEIEMSTFHNLLRHLSRDQPKRDVTRFEASAPRAEASSPPVLDIQRYKFSDPTVQIAAVGDIHGRIDLLSTLQPTLDRAADDPARRLIEIYLGDFIDHAGDSRAVIDYLIARRARSDRVVVCLAGNHEEMLLSALDHDSFFPKWLRYGGAATLKSYGLSPHDALRNPSAARAQFAAALPPEHLQFLKNLHFSYQKGGFLFVHAGLRPGVSLDRQVKSDMLWIREPFLSHSAPFGVIAVHGHTPSEAPVLRANRIGIDTGAYLTGRLTCLLINSDRIDIVETGAPTGDAQVPERATEKSLIRKSTS